MIGDEKALQRQLAYFMKCADAVTTPEEIPPHPHTGFVHVSLIPTRGGDVRSVNSLFAAALEAGDIDKEMRNPCRLCVDRSLYEVIRNSSTFPRTSYRSAQALIFRLAILQCSAAIHVPSKAEETVATRMANIRATGNGSPKSVSWPQGEYVRMLAGNEEYLLGTKSRDKSEEEGGFHYFCVTVNGFDFQCVFEHIGKSRGLGPAMSEMTRLAMLTAAWQRHSGGFPVKVPVLRPRKVIIGPQLEKKLEREVSERAKTGRPLLEPRTVMVPLEGVRLFRESVQGDSAYPVLTTDSAYSLRSATNQVFTTGDGTSPEVLCHLLEWMDAQRMGDEPKLGWPRLVEAQKGKSGSYYFEEDETDGLQHDAAEEQLVQTES